MGRELLPHSPFEGSISFVLQKGRRLEFLFLFNMEQRQLKLQVDIENYSEF